MVRCHDISCKTRRNIFFARLNQLGNVESELSLNNDCVPTYLDKDESTGGFVISNANTGLASVSSTGDCQLLVDYSEDEENTDVFGVVALPSGDFMLQEVMN